MIEQHVKATILLGSDAKKIAAVIPPSVSVSIVNDMNAAVNLASELSVPDDLVLLAPACASLDMYENYQRRGDAFVTAVKRQELC